ncbi:hypothetical protein AeNC1_007581 [Aphanomyces euteiches]|nr:hypothetical protein AeNC1_007581 [Aphanomyces euteiches]
MHAQSNAFQAERNVDEATAPLFGQPPPSLSFGQYMASKIKKLRHQNEGIKKTSRIFEGVAIYVNGRTEPSKEVLRTIILQHGGQFEAYLTGRVTHMIAVHVADSKLREIMKMKKPLPIVHPKWIEASLAAKKRCSIHPYVYARFNDPLQHKLSSHSLLTHETPKLSTNDVLNPQPTESIPSQIPSTPPKSPATRNNDQLCSVRHIQSNCPQENNLNQTIDQVPFGPKSKESMGQRYQNPFKSPSPVMKPIVPLLCHNSEEDKRTMYPSTESVPTPVQMSTSSLLMSDTLRLQSLEDNETNICIPVHPEKIAKGSQGQKVPIKSTPIFDTKSTTRSFGQYMSSKISKLRQQNLGLKQLSQVFNGVTIFVNGRTVPSKEVLRRLILQHGGKFESYLTKEVTHMVAEHVSDSKLRELKTRMKPLPIVHPSWLVDSIAQNKRCPMKEYLFVRSQNQAQFVLPLSFVPGKDNLKSVDPLAVAPSIDENFGDQDIPSITAELLNVPKPKASMIEERPNHLSPTPIQELPSQFCVSQTQIQSPQASSTLKFSQALSEATLLLDSPASPASTLVLSPVGSFSNMLDRCVNSQTLDDSPSGSTQRLSCSKNCEISLGEGASPEVFEIDPKERLHDSRRPETSNDMLSEVNPCINEFDSQTDEQGDFIYSQMVSEEYNQSVEEISTDEKTNAVRTNQNTTFRPIKSTRDGAAAFVASFFANSRLHHIGSWKLFYQQHVGEFMRESTVSMKESVFGSCEKNDRIILHVDMDCFFVSVAIRNLPPVYQTLPVAVAHSGYSSHDSGEAILGKQPSNKKRGTSEISSCNYIARSKGLKAGMFMETAKELCPNLIVLPYDFTAIEEVSCQLYKIFFRFTPAVQAMSCDEAYLELPKGSCGVEVAKEIRKAIYETTKCNASVGVSYNILLARLATKHAKPNNVFEITSSNVDDLLKDLYVRDLPGVGRVLQSKLAEFGIEVCSDLLKWPEPDLCAQVGAKTGKMLLRFSRGVDSRPLEIASAAKSVSAEVNYGVRLSSNDEAIEFIEALAKEVHCRLKATGCLAGAIALKLKIRHPDAPLEPTKFMGHGWTNDTSKSIRFNAPTDSLDNIVSTSTNIWKQLQVVPQELRGAGIQLSRLCHTYTHIDSGPALPSIFAQAPKKAGTYDRSDILPPKPVK